VSNRSPQIEDLAFLWLLCLLAAALLTACSSQPPETLTISAAADLTYAFQEIGQQFEKETGIRPVFNFGSSGQLAQQIEQGAPVDLFAAANVSFVEELEKRGLILADTKQVYARGRIVLWIRADGGDRAEPTLAIARLEDLLRPEVQRIAIANPDHAPYGAAAREALQATGIWGDPGRERPPGAAICSNR
jgi:molybdate transport system substrate-binding protein